MILPIIMAGGTGTRLWPLSRQLFPKQFLTLNGNNSMLQNTAQRLKGIKHQPPVVICNEEHRFSIAEQFRLNHIENSGILLEPVGRNTAPAVALAAFNALKNGEAPLLLVLAADHVIEDEEVFCQGVNIAREHAKKGKLVTFGIVPTAAETGYGCIKRGEPIDVAINNKALQALPTRDAVLPAIMLLAASIKKGNISSLVTEVSQRFSASDRIKNFATAKSQQLINEHKDDPSQLVTLLGFDEPVMNSDTADGLRITLANNDIIHLRPSGNAPELRCYAEAADELTAQALVTKVLAKVITL
jgi:NDP-sugar pyrophosphorylase family protein